MSKELRELHNTIASYALEHSVNEIPPRYFKRIEKTWQDMNLNGHDWDKSKAAAVLLYTAVIDGIVHQSQMTPQGYRALDWAENFQKKCDSMPA